MGLIRRFLGQSESHVVEVLDTRPPLDEPDAFEPYFAAVCECGWADPEHTTEAGARAAALAHDSNVVPGARRPVG